MYSIGAYSSWFDATDPKWGGNGSVTVMAVILAPVSLAKSMACSTALAARSDPSVGTRMFLNICSSPCFMRPGDRGHAGFRRSRRPPQLGRPPRWEMRKIMSECDPPVLRLLPNGYRRRWEVGVMKSTDCNADMVWPQVGLPKHRRSARRAKMHPNLSSLLPVADIDVGRSFRANMFLPVEGSNAEHRTGSPLTRATMAGAYNIRIGGYFDAQGTATAMRGSRHSSPPSSG